MAQARDPETDAFMVGEDDEDVAGRVQVEARGDLQRHSRSSACTRDENDETMTVRQVVWFIAAYVAVVALAMWFNLAVLCQGDAKFDRGCGGFALYIPMWLVFLSPLPVAAILLELWRKTTPPPTTRLLAYLAGIMCVTEVGFLLIEKFPILLATEAAAIGIGCLVRFRRPRR